MTAPPGTRKRRTPRDPALSTRPSDETNDNKTDREFDYDRRVIQPMPELAPEQLDALRNDIAANGVLQPVVIDQHGRILDGNHRAAIAQELGLDYPTVIVTVQDDADAWDNAVTLNCARRHMTREQVRDVIGGEIRRRPDDSDRAIARRVGCSPSTVGSVRAEIRAEAVEGTNVIREEIEQMSGQIAVMAHLQHRDERQDWQTVGDVLERSTMMQLSRLDTEWWDVVWQPLWKNTFGQLFDSIRAYDCPTHCPVCTPFGREWRDQHPRQVYRWAEELSNLDTQAVTE